MARDRGQIYEASDWFKEALQINQVKNIEFFALRKCMPNVAVYQVWSQNIHKIKIYCHQSLTSKCSLVALFLQLQYTVSK